MQAVAAAAPSVGGGAGGSRLLRSATVANPFDVAELLSRISLLAPSASAGAAAGMGGPRPLSADSTSGIQWIQPSGALQLLPPPAAAAAAAFCCCRCCHLPAPMWRCPCAALVAA